MILNRFNSVSRGVLVFAALSAIALCGLIGCDSEKKARLENERVMIEKLKKMNKGGTIPESVQDSLRARKARFHITRDEYWEAEGGVLANDYFELWYPPGPLTVSHGMYAFTQLVEAKGRFKRYFGRDPGGQLVVVCTSSMPDFEETTGKEWWHYARINGDEIVFQPIDILHQRQLGEVAIQRVYHEWGVEKLSGERSPQWLVEGMASLLAGEDQLLEIQLTEFEDQNHKLAYDQTESYLVKKDDRKRYRIAAYCAWRMARRLVAAYGQEKVVEAVVSMGEGNNRDEVFKRVFGRSYDDVVAYVMEFKVGE